MDRSVVHLVRRHLRHPLSCRRVFLRIPLPHRLVLQRSRRLVLLRSCRRMFPANLPRLRLVLLHLRQLFLTHSRPRRIRDKVKEARGLTLHDRVDLLAEEAATALAHGRSAASGRRPDLAAARDEEAEHLAEVQRMVPQHGVRPSALSPATKAAFSLLGSAAALMPRSLSGAISAGVQDALTDTYNEQLRQLREAGVAEEVPDVRAMIRRLRDRERAPEGAPRAPDITDVRRLSELSPQEGVAAAVKVGTKLMLELAKKL